MAAALHCVASGPESAPALVILHYMGAPQTMWDAHREALSTRFRVLTPDLPGYGQSAGPFTVEGSLAGLRALLSGTDDVHLVGLSLGARVAARYAADFPVASLMLLGCGIRPGPAASRGVTVARLLPSVFYPSGPAGAAKETVVAAKAELADLDLTDALPQIAARTLVVQGEKDTRYAADARELAATIPQAQLRVIPGAGHLWPTRQPQVFIDLVTGWLAED